MAQACHEGATLVQAQLLRSTHCFGLAVNIVLQPNLLRKHKGTEDGNLILAEIYSQGKNDSVQCPRPGWAEATVPSLLPS